MFESNKLPTLDTNLWWDGRRVMHDFYDKPTCPNREIQKDTALAVTSIQVSLNQEVVSRLLNCHLDLPLREKQAILSEFGQKLVNSGHSVTSSQIILVHGASKYAELVSRSKLQKGEPKYKPLHYGKEYNKTERKLSK